MTSNTFLIWYSSLI